MSIASNPIAGNPPPRGPQSSAGGGAAAVNEVRATLHQHLKRTAIFIKYLEAVTLLFCWAAALIALWLCASVVDHWLWPLPWLGRWLFWSIGVAVTAWLGGFKLLPLLFKRISPVYAARRIESLVPEFKNGLISWLELEALPNHGVPRGVMASLAYRAARFIGGQEPSSTVDTSGLIKLIAGVLLLLTSLAIYTMLSPKSVAITGYRIAAPWASIPPPTRVQILSVTPGDVEITQGSPLPVEVELRGLRNDEAVRVRFSSRDGQLSDVRTELRPSTAGFRYEGVVKTDSRGVEQEIDYWLEAGDASSGPYRVSLNPLPSVALQAVRLEYPAYTGLPPRIVAGERVEAVEGTRVHIVARANQPLRRGRIELHPELNAAGELIRAEAYLDMTVDGRTLQGDWLMLLNAAGDNPTLVPYRIRGYNQQGAANLRPVTHQLAVLADLAPEVNLMGPENRTLRVGRHARVNVEVRASDPDYGLAHLELQLKRRGAPIHSETLIDDLGLVGNQVRTHSVELTDLEIAVGDRLELVAVARDNRHDPHGQTPAPNVAQSQPLFLEVVAGENADGTPESPPAATRGDGDTSTQSTAPRTGSPPSEQNSSSQEPAGENTVGSEQRPNADPRETSAASSPKSDDSSQRADRQQDSKQSDASQQDPQQNDSPQKGRQQDGSTQDDSRQDDSAQQDSTEDGSGGSGAGDSAEGGSASQGARTGDSANSDSPSSDARSSESQSAPASTSSKSRTSDGTQGSADGAQGSSQSQPGSASPDSGPAQAASDREAMQRIQKFMNEQSGGAGNSPRDGNDAPTAPDPDMGAGEPEDARQKPQTTGTSDSTGQEQASDSTDDPDASPQNQSSDGQSSDGQSSDGQSSDGQPPGDSTSRGAGKPGDPSPAGDQPNTADSGAREDGNSPVPTSDQDTRPSTSSPPGDSNEVTGNNSQSDNSLAEPSPGTQQQPASPPGAAQSESAQSTEGQQQSGGELGSRDESTGTEEQDSSSSPAAPESQDGDAGAAGGSQDSQSSPSSSSTSQPDSSQSESSAPQNSGEQATGEQSTGEQSTGEQSTGEQATGEQATEGTSSPGSPSPGSGLPSPSATGQGSGVEGGEGGSTGTKEAVNQEYARRAADMLLDYLNRQKDQPDPRLLDDLDWTEQDLRRFVERWNRARELGTSGDEAQRKRWLEQLRDLGMGPADTGTRRGSDINDTFQQMRDAGSRARPPERLRRQYEAYRQALEGRLP